MSPRKHQYAGVGEKGIATVELRLLSKCHRKVKWGEGIFRTPCFHNQWSEIHKQKGAATCLKINTPAGTWQIFY